MSILKPKLVKPFLLAAVIFVTGCSAIPRSPEPMPEDTIEEFESAINSMDVNGIMECLDESAAKSVTASMKIAMGVAEAVTGISLGISAEDLLSLMPLMQGLTASSMSEGSYPQIDFQVTETYIKGDKATVFFTEENSGENMVINMKKKDKKWRITFDVRPIEKDMADRVIVAGQEKQSEAEDEVLVQVSSEEYEFSLPDLFTENGLKEILRGLIKE
ncbi:MAG: hypothetical protein HFG54_13720 [Lachnospiraceae bacterium]|jgi:hypothetical protein|nr:hypothetical protein [Lachnospiraceae bacterium]